MSLAILMVLFKDITFSELALIKVDLDLAPLLGNIYTLISVR